MTKQVYRQAVNISSFSDLPHHVILLVPVVRFYKTSTSRYVSGGGGWNPPAQNLKKY